MASSLETEALKAFIHDDYELAVVFFTQAISLRPYDAKLFAGRSRANHKRRNLTEAVADASRAIELDPSMSRAYLCMGNAYYELEKYQTAKTAWEFGSSLAPGDARFTNLIKRCDERIAEIYGEILNPPLVKATTQVVPVEGGRESGQIMHEVPNQVTSKLNVNSKDSCYASTNSTSKWERVDCDTLEAQVTKEEKEEKLGVDAFRENIENLADAWQNKITGTGSQRPSNPSSKRQKLDSDKVEAQEMEENRE